MFRDESIIYYHLNKNFGNVRLELYSEMPHIFQFFHPLEDMSLFAIKNIKIFIDSIELNKMEAVEYDKNSRGVIFETVLNNPYLLVEEGYEEMEKIKSEFPKFEEHLPEIISKFKPENQKLRLTCQSEKL